MPTTRPDAPADTEPSPLANEPRYVARTICSDLDDSLLIVTDPEETEHPLLTFQEPPYLPGGEEFRGLVLTPERAIEIASALTAWALAEMRGGR